MTILNNKNISEASNIDHNTLASEQLTLFCHKLIKSVEDLRGSINRYESYKNSKKAIDSTEQINVTK